MVIYRQREVSQTLPLAKEGAGHDVASVDVQTYGGQSTAARPGLITQLTTDTKLKGDLRICAMHR